MTATYDRVFDAAGRVEVYRVEQVGLSYRKAFVALTTPIGAAAAEERDRVYLELLAMRPAYPNGRAYWAAMTRRLRLERAMTPHQKYRCKRACLGCRKRDAGDARQLSLLSPSP